MSDDLIRKLRHLVSLNEPRNGGPYQGTAALACVDAMSEAAAALAAKDTALSEMRAELEMWRSVKHSSHWHDRATAAEAQLERVKECLADIELDIHLASEMSRGYDLGPALAKIRSLIASQDEGE